MQTGSAPTGAQRQQASHVAYGATSTIGLLPVPVLLLPVAAAAAAGRFTSMVARQMGAGI